MEMALAHNLLCEAAVDHWRHPLATGAAGGRDAAPAAPAAQGCEAFPSAGASCLLTGFSRASPLPLVPGWLLTIDLYCRWHHTPRRRYSSARSHLWGLSCRNCCCTVVRVLKAKSPPKCRSYRRRRASLAIPSPATALPWCVLSAPKTVMPAG